MDGKVGKGSSLVLTDQTGHQLTLNYPPRRIVSLVPSQTELLYDLGLEEEVVGITKFCIRPQQWFRKKERIGGTKTLDLKKIRALCPDLILANKEENEKEQVETLQKNFPVWVSAIYGLDDALAMIRSVGIITGRKEKAGALADTIQHIFSMWSERKPVAVKVAYLIWKEPFMVAGGNTFINNMLKRCGFVNVFESREERYPEIRPEELAAAGPEVVLLSSEPYPFREKHIAEIQALAPYAKIKLVDGELFSWYGSRLLYTADYFSGLLEELKK